MKLRNLIWLSVLATFAFSAAGCARRRVVVVHDPYPVQTVAPAYPPGTPPPVAPSVVVPGAPPAPQVETIPPPPGPTYVWVGGYWVWQGEWRWRPGLWLAPPRPAAVWVPGRWIHNRRWVWVGGHWR